MHIKNVKRLSKRAFSPTFPNKYDKKFVCFSDNF